MTALHQLLGRERWQEKNTVGQYHLPVRCCEAPMAPSRTDTPKYSEI